MQAILTKRHVEIQSSGKYSLMRQVLGAQLLHYRSILIMGAI